MKMRRLVVGTTAALISLGAIAGGQQHPQSRDSTAPLAVAEVETVREALQRLRDAGYATTPDGVKEFQHAKGIEPTGRLDSATLAALGIEPSASTGASSQPDEKPSN